MFFFFSINVINLILFLIFHFFDKRFFLAVSVSLEFFIILIISSIFSTAVAKPIKICALCSAFFKSNLTLLRTVSSLNFKNSEINSFKLRIFGLLLTIASVLKPKELSIFVNLYNCRLIVSGSIAFLSSITTLIPSLFDSSLISLMPSIFLSLTNCAILSIKTDLLTW